MEKKDIQNLGDLSRISLTEKEADALGKDLEKILGYVKEIEDLHIESLSEERDVLRNVLRADTVTRAPSEYTETLLSAAPETEEGYIAVKTILPS